MTAPESERVDLAEPTFSDPTAVTNPRFPIAELDQVIQLGEEASAALRFEVTLLPDAKVIEWNGQQVETLVSQFVAYEDGRVLEVAVDFFAQADDGAVWYFGEDVANYVDGAVIEAIRQRIGWASPAATSGADTSRSTRRSWTRG